jgi:hypothetical protein
MPFQSRRPVTPWLAIRVEHLVVAERQRQSAALNMLGYREQHTAVPFFRSRHYDMRIKYVGHAEKWDEFAVDGDIAGKNCLLSFKRDGRTLAVATISRDVENLQAEVAMEKGAPLKFCVILNRSSLDDLVFVIAKYQSRKLLEVRARRPSLVISAAHR